MPELRKATNGKARSPETRAKIGAARTAWLKKNRPRLRKAAQERVVAGLNELESRSEPLNPNYVSQNYPTLYRAGIRVFGSYQATIEQGKKVPYETVRVSDAEKRERVSAAAKSAWSKFDAFGRKKRNFYLVKARQIAHRKRTMNTLSKVLSYRLQGYSLRKIAGLLNLQPDSIKRWSSRLKRAVTSDLVTRLRALDRMHIGKRGLFQVSGDPALSLAEATRIAREFRTALFRKFASDQKTTKVMALDGKSALEIGRALTLPEEEVNAFLSWLSDRDKTQIRKLHLVRIRQRTSVAVAQI